MLSQLYIENVAVIEKVSIDFAPGLNVLTGETGAGKSILIDSISAVLGQRTSKDMIRSNTNSSLIVASFSDFKEHIYSELKEMDIEIDDYDNNELLIQRVINISGKSSCKINLRPSTVTVLREIGSKLINIHGQNDSYELLSKDLHIKYIDSFGNILSVIEIYQKEYRELMSLKARLNEICKNRENNLRMIDILKYQINEIESAKLNISEIDELKAKRAIYMNHEKISLSLNSALEFLRGGNSVTGAMEAVGDALSAMRAISEYSSKAADIAERLDSVYYELEDCCSELNSMDSDTEYDPLELEEIENRLNLIQNLSRKYGSNVQEILKFLEKCKSELKEIDISDEDIEELKQEYLSKEKKVLSLAQKLSEKRREISKNFLKRVKKELEFLDMKGISFTISHKTCEINSLGCDDIQFLVSTNTGERAKPLTKIASGGELARIMLAIKTVLAEKDKVSTLIFDEIDSGLSGSAAQKVGLKLKELSKYRQIICITHSAQIAAYADKHFLIKKAVEEGRTFTNVKPLDFNGRKHELARIIGGVKITDLTLANADEMLKMSGLNEKDIKI